MSLPVHVSNETYQLSPDRQLHLQLLKFPGGTLLLRIGDKSGRGVMDNLSLAIGQSATSVIDNDNVTSQMIARKLSAKYNGSRPVYVSLGLEPEAVCGESLLAVMSGVNEFVRRECSSGSGGDGLADRCLVPQPQQQ
jgi:hypothetical protein